jgi:hypothetical protein
MLKSRGERLDFKAGRNCGLFAVVPADHGSDMCRRKEILMRFRQIRVRADLAHGIERIVVAASGDSRRGTNQR